MDVLSWTERPRLRDPVVICALRGWNDAGESASAALSVVMGNFEARQVATLDPEEFYDFTAVRPTIKLEEGRTRVVEWPSNTLHVARVPGAERDLVLVQGTEPSLRWRTFCTTIVDAARELGAGMVVTLGALLADVPHSRPTAITGLASDESLVEGLALERSSYEGPTGIIGVLHDACARADVASVSLWASVPHYIAAAPNPKAALELVRRVEGLVGVAVDAGDLEEAAEEYERQVSAAVASDPEVRAFVEQLEESMDEAESTPDPSQIPSADTIARDFQRFLRQRGPEQG